MPEAAIKLATPEAAIKLAAINEQIGIVRDRLQLTTDLEERTKMEETLANLMQDLEYASHKPLPEA